MEIKKFKNYEYAESWFNSLKPGDVVIDGYIRILDCENDHRYNCVFEIKTGKIIHWSKLFNKNKNKIK